MSKLTLTNMVMVIDKTSDRVLVQNRIKEYPGIAFPGGHVEKGESIYDSAIREIREETGYDIKNLKSHGFIYWDNSNGDKYFTYFFTTSDYSGVMLSATNEGSVQWVSRDELLKMKLAPNMDKYITMLEGSYCECYCKRLDNGEWEVIYR